MNDVFYFKRLIKWILVLHLPFLTLMAQSATPGIQNGQWVVAPDNSMQSKHSHLKARSGNFELSTKEFVGEIEQKTLVVLISFEDQVISTPIDEWENRIFNDEFSVNTFFETNSQGKFHVVPAVGGGVIEVVLDREHPDFGSSYSQSTRLANDALEQAAKQVDFSKFDTNGNKTLEVRELALVFVGAGYEKSFGGENANHPNIWGHQSSSLLLVEDYRASGYVLFGEKHGSKQASIGIICHELGHLYFNLPDLYDRDGSSAGAGNWGVMSYGTWGSSGEQLGDRPVNMLAWSRQKIGFLKLNEPVEGEAITHDRPVKLATQNEDEYFIVEYRTQEGFDSSLAGSGILITHIDESVSKINDNESHKLIDIEQASGDQTLDDFSSYGKSTDLFATSASKWSFDENTTPNSDVNSNDASSVSVMFAKVDGASDLVSITSYQSSPQSSEFQLGSFNMIWLSLLLLMLFYVRVRINSQKRLKVRI